jgi:FlgD Ig-like domain/Divergent InlB B-repeat domain
MMKKFVVKNFNIIYFFFLVSFSLLNAQHTISVVAGSHGNISPSGPENVSEGSNFSFTITADPGYEIENVSIDGLSVGTVSVYGFVNVTGNHTISASFITDSGTEQIISAINGEMEVASMPADLSGGEFTSPIHIRLIHEGTGTIEPGTPDFQYDGAYHNPSLGIVYGDVTFGNAITTAYSGSGLPSVGTEVYCLLLHFDPAVSGLPFDLSLGIKQSAEITFTREIIGVYVTSAALDNTDDIFSPTGTIFPLTTGRDMEFNYDGDYYLVSPDRYTLTLTMFSHNGGVLDEMRVILVNNNDGPLAVQLLSFKATQVTQGIELKWLTASQSNNAGFEIWRSEAQNSEFNRIASYKNNPALIGEGNSSTSKEYIFLDNSVKRGKTYSYKLSDVDYSGQSTFYKAVTLDLASAVPDDFKLYQNFPNPFNPQTKIRFYVPQGNTGKVSILIYNLSGQLVKTLFDNHANPGFHEVIWNARQDNGSDLPSGIYLLEMRYQNLRQVQKMVFLK